MEASFAHNAAYELVVRWPDGDTDAVFWGQRAYVEWLLVNVVSTACEWNGRRVIGAWMRPANLILGAVDETS